MMIVRHNFYNIIFILTSSVVSEICMVHAVLKYKNEEVIPVPKNGLEAY